MVGPSQSYTRQARVFYAKAYRPEETQLWWNTSPASYATNCKVVDFDPSATTTHSDGKGHTAAATIGESFYLGKLAAVMDAEMQRIAMAGDTNNG